MAIYGSIYSVQQAEADATVHTDQLQMDSNRFKMLQLTTIMRCYVNL